jgi:hypothetical protein
LQIFLGTRLPVLAGASLQTLVLSALVVAEAELSVWFSVVPHPASNRLQSVTRMIERML